MQVTDLDSKDNQRDLKSAYDRVVECDGLIVLMESSQKSEGMLVEIGFAYKKVPIYLYRKAGVATRVDSLADTVIEWSNQEELLEIIKDGV